MNKLIQIFRIIFIALLLLCFENGYSQVYQKENRSSSFNNYNIHQSLGNYQFKLDDGNYISLDGFITKNYNTNAYINYKYVYRLYLTSVSKHENLLTQTWLHTTKIFIGNEMVYIYPNYFYVRTTPTLIYEFYTNLETIRFYCSWDNAYLEPSVSQNGK